MADPLNRQWWSEDVREWLTIKQDAGVTATEAIELDQPRDPKLPAEVFRNQQGMYWAARNGDWVTAQAIISNNPRTLTAKVTMTGMTALHIAAAAGHTHFVKQLIKHMKPEDLAIGDNDKDTAFHYAVMQGKLEVAEILHKNNGDLITSRGFNGNLPINTAALGRPKDISKELLWFLVRETGEPFVGDDKDFYLLARLTLLSYHDITLSLLNRRKHLATAKASDGKTLLDFLVGLSGDFSSTTKLAFWETWIYKLAPLHENDCYADADEEANPGNTTHPKSSDGWKVQVCKRFRRVAWSVITTLAPAQSQRLMDVRKRHDSALMLLRFILDQVKELNKPDLSAFFTSGFVTRAARDGITEVVKECLEKVPYESMGEDKETKLNPIDAAIRNRQENVVVVIHKAVKQLTDNPTPNSLWLKKRVKDFEKFISGGLHSVAILAPTRRLQRISSPALQMQSEIQWFQELEKRTDLISREVPNKCGKTARQVFTDDHRDLLEKAEGWMKNMSSSCMLAATLIATVAFAAAYTLPGGNYENKGTPIFLEKIEFKAFLVSDATALSSSITSLLMFLSILTSRFAEEDFARKLPTKLIMGLSFLFIAMATMIIAFVFSLWIVVNDAMKWISILSTALAAIPVLVFIILQLPLFVGMSKSTFGRGFIDLSAFDD